ncbi:MAG TPA: hypothetical protein VGK23_07320 [Methanomassiliicoccales archaeon]
MTTLLFERVETQPQGHDLTMEAVLFLTFLGEFEAEDAHLLPEPRNVILRVLRTFRDGG